MKEIVSIFMKKAKEVGIEVYNAKINNLYDHSHTGHIR